MTCPRCGGTLVPDECDDTEDPTMFLSEQGRTSIEYVCLECGRRTTEATMMAEHHEEVKDVDRPTTPEGWDAYCWSQFDGGKTAHDISRGLGCVGTHTAVAQSRARWELRNESKREAVVSASMVLPSAQIALPIPETPPAKAEPRKLNYPMTRDPARTQAEIDAILWPKFDSSETVTRAARQANVGHGVAERSHMRWKTQTVATKGTWSRLPRCTQAEWDALLWPHFEAGLSIAAAGKAAGNKSMESVRRSKLRWQATETVVPVPEDAPQRDIDVSSAIQPCVKNDTPDLAEIIGRLTFREYFALSGEQRAGIYAFAAATFGRTA